MVVLLHGATGCWGHWRPVLADLVARFDVVAPTLAGHHGGPEFPPDLPPTVGGVADSLQRHPGPPRRRPPPAGRLARRGLPAIQLAERGRAMSVVAISPACGWEFGSREGARVARFFARAVKRSRLALPRAHLLTRSSRARRIGFREAMRHGELVSPAEAVELIRATAQFTMLDELQRALQRDELALLAELDRIAVPILLAWGEHDRVLPASTCSTRFRREIAGRSFDCSRASPRPDVGRQPLIADTITGWVAAHTTAGSPAEFA